MPARASSKHVPANRMNKVPQTRSAIVMNVALSFYNRPSVVTWSGRLVLVIHLHSNGRTSIQ